MLSRKDAERLMKVKGQVRGAVFETDAQYILEKYGRAGLERLTRAMRDLDCQISYDDVSAMEWRSVGLRALTLRLMKGIFNWTDDDIRAMGDAAPKYSFIVKLFMKFFVSPAVAFSHAPEYWTKHYDVGYLEAVKLAEKERYAIVHLHDFEVDPIYCRYLEGFFSRLFKYMYPRSRIGINETECMCEGGEAHEFRVNWE